MGLINRLINLIEWFVFLDHSTVYVCVCIDADDGDDDCEGNFALDI